MGQFKQFCENDGTNPRHDKNGTVPTKTRRMVSLIKGHFLSNS